MIWRQFLFPVIVGFGLNGVALGQKERADPMINVDIPLEDSAYEGLRDGLRHLGDQIQPGDFIVSLNDFVGIILTSNDDDLDEETREKIEHIISRRENEVTLVCQGEKCRGVNRGEKINEELKIGDKKIKISLDQVIHISFRLTSDNLTFEACRIKGVKAQMSILSGNIDGLLIRLSETKIEQFKIDAGIGGSYPSKHCDF